MDAPAGSGSSGGKKKRKLRTLSSKLLPLELEVSKTDLTIGKLDMDKPSGVTNAPKWNRRVCLDLTDPNNTFALAIMRGIHHPNVLHLESVLGEGSSAKMCVEHYTGSLYDIVYKFRVAADHEMLLSLIRQMAEGIEELRLNGQYHGNVDIHTTYYDDPTKLVKLANFRQKGDDQSLTEAQFGDWHGLGNVIQEMSDMVRTNNLTYVDFNLLADLARELKNQSPPKMLRQVKDETLNHVLFWNRSRRSSFYIYGILEALHSSEFKAMVNGLLFIPEDWNEDVNNILLAAMNRYRVKNGGKEYKKGRHQYVVFVSGVYTHEKEVEKELEEEFMQQGKTDVDWIINRQSQPQLLVSLVRIVRQLGYNV